MTNTVAKWEPILNSFFKVSKRTTEFLAEYAERHTKNDDLNVVHGGNITTSTLPLALQSLVKCQILEFLHWNVRDFSEEVKPKSYKVTADYTQGRRDKVELVEAGISSKIADEISRETIEQMFKLGEINRFYHRSSTKEKGFVPEGEHVKSEYDFVRMLKRYLLGEACKLVNGEPFIVCNPKMVSSLILLGEEDYEHIEPLSKSLTSERAFIVGKYCGATVFSDPTMSYTDFRVLLGSSNSDAIGGLVFEPLHIYNNMNVVASNEIKNSGDGLTKIEVTNSYRFHSGSENSRMSYLTINFQFDKQA